MTKRMMELSLQAADNLEAAGKTITRNGIVLEVEAMEPGVTRNGWYVTPKIMVAVANAHGGVYEVVKTSGGRRGVVTRTA